MSNLRIISESEPHVTPGGQRLKTCVVQCICGKQFKALKGNISSGHTKSCGCLVYRKPSYHGMRGSPIYTSWDCMVQRCVNSKSAHFHNYGGRGIAICSEWRDFKAFYAWAIVNGWAEGLELDRVNNNGNYEPCNCRWVTPAQNNLNKRTNRNLTYQGQTKTLKEWSLLTGLRVKTIQGRLDSLGWDMEKTLTTPPSRSQGGRYAHLFKDIRAQL